MHYIKAYKSSPKALHLINRLQQTPVIFFKKNFTLKLLKWYLHLNSPHKIYKKMNFSLQIPNLQIFAKDTKKTRID